jgi:hypothetical protein
MIETVADADGCLRLEKSVDSFIFLHGLSLLPIIAR